MKTTHVVIFTLLGTVAGFLLCSGAALVGVTMSHARPYRYQSFNNTQTPKTAAVLVAKDDLAAGSRIAFPETQFRVRLYRIGEEPGNAVTDFNELRGKVLTRPLRRGEVCVIEDVQQLMVQLPEGKRAMAIRVSIGDEVGAFIQPGSRVDVQGQTPFDESGRSNMKIMAADALVLAVNRVADAPQPGMTVKPNQGFGTITVAVSPEEAVALAAAMQQGPLSVNLRRPKD